MTDLRTPANEWLVDEGDAWSVTVTLTDKATGNPIDLTGATITGKIRYANTDVLADIDAAIVAPASAGKFTYGQTSAQLTGRFRIRITPPGGLPQTRAKGTLSVDPDPTENPLD